MSKIEVKIKDKTYPCRPSMGALMRYKQETGEEVGDMKEGEVTKMCVYLWACTASASYSEGKEFPYSPLEFADALTIEEMRRITDMMATASAEQADGKKK